MRVHNEVMNGGITVCLSIWFFVKIAKTTYLTVMKVAGVTVIDKTDIFLIVGWPGTEFWKFNNSER